jgi:hypothetical protein
MPGTHTCMQSRIQLRPGFTESSAGVERQQIVQDLDTHRSNVCDLLVAPKAQKEATRLVHKQHALTVPVRAHRASDQRSAQQCERRRKPPRSNTLGQRYQAKLDSIQARAEDRQECGELKQAEAQVVTAETLAKDAAKALRSLKDRRRLMETKGHAVWCGLRQCSFAEYVAPH